MVNRAFLLLFLTTTTCSFFSYAADTNSADIDFYDSDEEIKTITSKENISPYVGVRYNGIIFDKTVPSHALKPRVLNPNLDTMANDLDKMHLNDHDDS